MKSRVRKLMYYPYYQSDAIEQRLEKLAKKGLFLEEIRPSFWIFTRREPKEVKYTVTYFSEASMFQPEVPQNQETYIDFAKEAGWDYVTQWNQMQVFISGTGNTLPFETDEREKLDNIKKCMNKSFLPSTAGLILVFLMNLFVQYQSFQTDPIDFLASTFGLFPVLVLIPAILYFIYIIVSYLIWYRKSKRSVEMGNGCIESASRFGRIGDIGFSIYIICSSIYCLSSIVAKMSIIIIILLVIQLPVLRFVFGTSVKRLRKKQKSAAINKVVSYSLLIALAIAYTGLIMFVIIKFDPIGNDDRSYRTVTWKLTPSESQEYKLYSDALPLTCEDLYGTNDYEYYSYEKIWDDSVFLSRSEYRQDSLPGRDAPPSITYTVIEPKFDFVYRIVSKELKEVPEWHDERLKPLDNEIFGTEQAYQTYLDRDGIGKYLLFYKDKIVSLYLGEPATEEQRAVIIEKLELGAR